MNTRSSGKAMARPGDYMLEYALFMITLGVLFAECARWLFSIK